MTELHELSNSHRGRSPRKRVGRGVKSGLGKTSGRGHKGAGSRSGYKRRIGYEGGQMRLFMKVPNRGFSNAPFRNEYAAINLYRIEEAYEDGEEVNIETLKKKGLVKNQATQVKLLGDGELKKKVTITVHAATATAKEKLQNENIQFTLAS